jgi:hypothetical protein
MTEETAGHDEQENNEQEDVVRRQGFQTEGPAELDITLGTGRLRVQLTDEPGVHVEVRADPGDESPWAQGLSSMLNWVGQQFGGRFDPAQFGMDRDFVTGFGRGGFGRGFGGFGRSFGRGFGSWVPGDLSGDEPGDDEGRQPRPPRHPFQPGQWACGWPGMASDEAVRQMRIQQSGNRIVVQAPHDGPLRMAPMVVTVQAPTGSRLEVRGAAVDVLATGKAGRVQVQSGTGDVAVDQADGPVRVQTSSGLLRLGQLPAGVTARSGSGDIEVGSIGASGTIAASSGSVRIGVVTADLTVRTGSGDLTITEAVRGRIQLITGSGEIRVGVRTGVTASIDLSSRTGEARSELPVSDSPPEDKEPELYLRGRSGSGDVLVTSALSSSNAS